MKIALILPMLPIGISKSDWYTLQGYRRGFISWKNFRSPLIPWKWTSLVILSWLCKTYTIDLQMSTHSEGRTIYDLGGGGLGQEKNSPKKKNSTAGWPGKKTQLSVGRGKKTQHEISSRTPQIINGPPLRGHCSSILSNRTSNFVTTWRSITYSCLHLLIIMAENDPTLPYVHLLHLI